MPFRVCRGRRAAVDFVVCFGWGEFFRGFFFFFERTRPAESMRPPCLNYLSTSNEAVFFISRKASSCRGAYRVPLFNQSVSLCVCVTFVVFTYCESCARPISTNPGSMEASEYGLTRGTCFVARRLEVVAVTGLLWMLWCVLGAVGFRVFQVFTFSNWRACTRPLAARDPEQSASTW